MKKIEVAVMLAASLVLAACGGGGGAASVAAGAPSAVAVNTAPVAKAAAPAEGPVGSVFTLDGLASSDADGDKLSYTWTVKSKPATSHLALGAATTAQPTFTPDASGEYTLTLVVNDGKVDSAPVELKVSVYTPLGGAITESTVLTKVGNPYRVIADLSLPLVQSLTVQPGVHIDGQSKTLSVAGKLTVTGASDSPVQVKNLFISVPNDKGYTLGAEEGCAVAVSWVQIDGGSAFGMARNGFRCHLELTDSQLTGTGPITLLGFGDSKIERNVFDRSAGIIFSLGSLEPHKHTLSIKNNKFSNWAGDFAVQNIAMGGNSTAAIQYNSFMDVGRFALGLETATSRIDTATNNYWGTTDLTVAQSMAHPRIAISPILMQPDANTPK